MHSNSFPEGNKLGKVLGKNDRKKMSHQQVKVQDVSTITLVLVGGGKLASEESRSPKVSLYFSPITLANQFGISVRCSEC